MNLQSKCVILDKQFMKVQVLVLGLGVQMIPLACSRSWHQGPVFPSVCPDSESKRDKVNTLGLDGLAVAQKENMLRATHVVLWGLLSEECGLPSMNFAVPV
ncbi:unnamed protein product, partial [Discosporangium mesarthrocarpum]